MKPIITVLIFFAFEIVSIGQINFKNPPWELNCDTISNATQLDLNQCSCESFDIADSILSRTYDKLFAQIDSNFIVAKKDISSKNDTIQISYVENLKRQKAFVLESQENFIKYRKSMKNIMTCEYMGGSMRPMVECAYALEITVNQLKTISTMLKEISGK